MTGQRLLVVGFLCVSAAAAVQGQKAPAAECLDDPGVDVLQVREWAFDPDHPKFPEMSDPDLFVPAVRERADDSFGIAFSGGGTRSASATLGQLRALAILGWLDRAQYITAVSGGSWAAVPFTFLPSRFSDEEFLGSYLPPAKLTDEILGEVPEGSFARAISSTKLAGLYLSRLAWGRGDETYSRAIGKRFLRDFDLYEGVRDGKCKGPARFFAAHERQRNRLLAGSRVRRPLGNDRWRCLCPEGEEGRLCADEVLIPAPGRPFLIVGATFFERKTRARRDQLHPVELTPLYAGIRKANLEHEGPKVGGGFIESVAYDGLSRRELRAAPNGSESAEVEVRFEPNRRSKYRYRFTLSDVMGASGAAPVAILRGLGFDTVGFPEFHLRPIGEDTPIRKDKKPRDDYAHGDGAHIDNLGLLPLLARGVRNILVFVNTQTEFKDCGKEVQKPCDKIKPGDETTYVEISKDIRCYFVRDANPTKDESSKLADKACYKNDKPKDGTVPLFKRDGLQKLENKFKDLAEQTEQKMPQPLIYCDKFTLVESADYGIQKYTPRICWFHLGRNETWMQAVESGAGDRDRGAIRKLLRGKRPFKSFPHYKTLADRWWKLRVIDLSEEQVNALAHLTAWEVLTGAEKIGGFLSLPPPEGSFPDPESSYPVPARRAVEE